MKRPQCFGGDYASDRCDETMPLILDDKQPIILVPDNSPIAALLSVCRRCASLHSQDRDNMFALLHPEKDPPRANPSAQLVALAL
jgi:hypothetical protein